MTNQKKLPLSGIKVVEWGHTVMGPTCGLILADMGAEVIKVERSPAGDDTRYMLGFGQSFFPLFNRNKKSLALNLKNDRGKAVLRKLIGTADVFVENFGPGAADRLGFSYEDCAAFNARLIYCSLKGFMPGPYENRPSLDNLVQMMGGLAFMTGRKGDPLRAGASVTDIMGGVFGALGIISALYEREQTGKGTRVIASLYEAIVFMVGQHMGCAAISGKPSIPMPEGETSFGVYDLFITADGESIFIAVTSDGHWQRFCDLFSLPELKDDPRLATNNNRVTERSWLIPKLTSILNNMTQKDIIAAATKAKIPFAPLMRPDQLFEDIHLLESDSLLETTFPGGLKTKMPKIPLRMNGYDFNLRNDPPHVGEYGLEVLADVGFQADEIDRLIADGILVAE